MLRRKLIAFPVLMTLASVTGVFAQNSQSPAVRIHQLKSPVQTNSILNQPSLATDPVAEVPAELVLEPGKIQFDSIKTKTKATTPVPAALQGSQPKPTAKVSPARLLTPRVARATSESWPQKSGSTRATANNQVSKFRSSKDQKVAHTAAAISTEILAPEFINLNQVATMKIQLRNSGSVDAQGVRLVTTLPKHARFESSDPQPVKVEGQRYEFVIAAIGAKQVRQITINIVPTEKLPLDISTDLVVENRQRIAVGVREPHLNVRVNGPVQATIGELVEYEVVIENAGDGVADTVRLEAEFPEALRFTDQKSLEIAKRLNPGKIRKVIVKAIAQKTGDVNLSFVANAVGATSRPASLNLRVVQPELKVSVAGPKLNFVNRDGIYSIRLDNSGVVAVSQVKVKLVIPEGMEVTTISVPAQANDRDHTLTWTFDEIASQSSETIQLKAISNKAGNQVCRVDVNTHETRQKQFDLSTTVATRAEMSVNIQNESGPVQVGEKAEFVISIQNKGSRDANDVSVRVELPESMMPVKQDGVTVDEFNRSFVFSKPGLKAGDKHEFRFFAVGAAGGEFVVRGVLENGQSQRTMIAEDSVFVYEMDEFRVSESLSPSINR